MPGLEVSAPPKPEVTKPNTAPANADQPLRVVLTGLDKNLDSFAREAAHEKQTKHHEGPLWKRMAKSVWSVATREYQIVKDTKASREDILKHDNFRHHKGESDKAWRQGVIIRYSSDYAEHLVHQEAGETFQKLGAAEAKDDPNAQQIREDTLDLLRQYAQDTTGSVDEASLELMIERMVQTWRQAGISQQYIGEGNLRAHNIVEMARQAKAALDARQGLSDLERSAALEDMLAKAEVVTGEAKVGSSVEIDSTLSERLAEKLKKVPFIKEERIARVTSIVGNELVMAAMLSVGAYGLKGVVAKAGAIVAPGLGAGVVAFFRERRALKDERALGMRRLDQGQTPDLSNKSQAELAATFYEARSAGDILDDLGSLYDKDGKLDLTDQADIELAMSLQAELKARIQIGDREGKRLINFADISPEEMEGRRFDIDLALAKLEVDLKGLFANPPAGIKLDKTFEEWDEEEKSIMLGMLKGQMKQKDRLFRKLVGKRGLKRALAATFVGSAIGFLAQLEIRGASRFSELIGGLFGYSDSPKFLSAASQYSGNGPDIPDQIGDEVEIPNPIGDRVEIPETIGNKAPEIPHTIGDEVPKIPEVIGDEATSVTILSDTAKISHLPEGFTAEHTADQLVITSPDGERFSLELNDNGTISTSAQETLRQAGFSVIDHQELVQGEPEVSHVTVTPTEFMQNHKDEMVQIEHERWLHNLTAGSDLNELGLQNQLQSNGDIVVSIQGMTAAGSFDQQGSLDWQEAASAGHLSVFLSASDGTQAHAIEVPFNANGTAVIESNSPARALFNDNGVFIGGYQSASVHDNVDTEGKVRLATLATVVGESSSELTDTIETPTLETAHSYTITQVEPMAMTSTFSEVPSAQQEYTTPIVTPLVGRRRLGEFEQQPQPAATTTTNTNPIPPPASPQAPPSPNNAGNNAGAQQSTNASAATSTPGAPGPNTAPSSGGGAESGTQNNQTGAENYTPQERVLLQEIDSETRTFPPGFDVVNLSGHTERSRKIATRLIYEAMERFPRRRGEDDFMYNGRLAQELHNGALVGLTRLRYMSRNIATISEGAFGLLLSVQPKF
jgi:hypothetical protein